MATPERTTMRIVCSALVLVTLGTVTGCGGASADPDLVPVAGNIAVDGSAAGNIELTFIPQGDTKGQGGTGRTDSTGRYEVANSKGNKGLPPGKYKVVASRRLNPDGSPPDPNTPPIESNAKETLPVIYTDPEKTQLTLTIAAGDKRSFDFDLKVKKK